MSRIPYDTLALGLDGPFPAPTLQVCRSAHELALACAGRVDPSWDPSPHAPALVVALGPPAQRAVLVSDVQRRGDLVTVRYRIAPRTRLPQSILQTTDDRIAAGLNHPGSSSAYHVVQLHGLPPRARFRFERELERSVMGTVEVRGGQVLLEEDPLFAPIGTPSSVRIRHGGFEGDVPHAFEADTPGVPLALIAPPPVGRSRFVIPDARSATSFARLRGLLVRVDGVIRRIRGPELLPERAWLIETGDQVYGARQDPASKAS